MNHDFPASFSTQWPTSGFGDKVAMAAINFPTCSGRLDALQEQLGHRDINTTRIYLRLSDEDVKRELAKIRF